MLMDSYSSCMDQCRSQNAAPGPGSPLHSNISINSGRSSSPPLLETKCFDLTSDASPLRRFSVLRPECGTLPDCWSGEISEVRQ